MTKMVGKKEWKKLCREHIQWADKFEMWLITYEGARFARESYDDAKLLLTALVLGDPVPHAYINHQLPTESVIMDEGDGVVMTPIVRHIHEWDKLDVPAPEEWTDEAAVFTLPTRANRDGDTQPLPKGNGYPIAHEMVKADLDDRLTLGIKRYGQPLQPFNGRDSLRDAYEEALDLCVYLRAALFERDSVDMLWKQEEERDAPEET